MKQTRNLKARRGALNAGLTGMLSLALLAACEREVILPGERFPVRAPLDASQPVEGQPAPLAPPDQPVNQSAPISIPAQTANAEWTHRGGDARHHGPNGALSAAPQRVWSVGIGTGNSRKNRVSAAPVVAGGRVFAMDALSDVSAVSTSGALLWKVDLTPDFDRSSTVSGGGLAYGGGRLYATTGFGEVLAIDPVSGGVVWRQRTDSPATGAPTFDNGLVYVVGRDGSGWAIDAATGKVRWQLPGTPASAGMLGAASPAVSDNVVIFPFASGQLAATLKTGGTQVWGGAIAGRRLGRAYATILGDITGDPVIVGRTAYLGTAAGRTAAIDTATGEKLWTADDGALNPPLVVGGSVFVVNDQAQLVRLNATTGERIWAADMPYFTKDKVKRRKGIYAHYGPVLAGGRIAVASSDGALRFFSPVDGTLVASAEIPGGAASPPALAAGMLFVVGGNGQVHAFR